MPHLPGTPEEFFDKLATFLRANARGEVRCFVLTQTSTKQFWISSMVDDFVWQDGMMRTADRIITHNFHARLDKMADEISDEQEAQDLRAAEIKGKAN